MKTGVRLFVSSSVFGAVICTGYWFVSYDIVGTTLLGIMTAALVIIAVYIRFAERKADLGADDDKASPSDAAGETIGAFALESFWPPVAALAVVLMALGAVFAPGVSFAVVAAGLALAIFVARLMVREST